jgi:hypothetical protein
VGCPLHRAGYGTRRASRVVSRSGALEVGVLVNRFGFASADRSAPGFPVDEFSEDVDVPGVAGGLFKKV